jgi:hypothetical protein
MTRLRIVAALLMTFPLAACGHSSQGADGQGGGGASASCAAPAISTKPFRVRPAAGPVHVRPGQRLTVYGKFYASDCHDTGQRAPDAPIPSVQIAFASSYRTLPLATVHPHGPESSFRVAVRIPPTTPAGPARLFDTSANRVIRLLVER